MNLGHIVAVLAILFIARELWTGVAFIPWSMHSAPDPHAQDRRVRKGEHPGAYWLAVGLHCLMITVALFLMFR